MSPQLYALCLYVTLPLVKLGQVSFCISFTHSPLFVWPSAPLKPPFHICIYIQASLHTHTHTLSLSLSLSELQNLSWILLYNREESVEKSGLISRTRLPNSPVFSEHSQGSGAQRSRPAKRKDHTWLTGRCIRALLTAPFSYFTSSFEDPYAYLSSLHGI